MQAGCASLVKSNSPSTSNRIKSLFVLSKSESDSIVAFLTCNVAIIIIIAHSGRIRNQIEMILSYPHLLS